MHKGHEATIAGLTVYLFGLYTEATHLQDSLKLQVIFQQTDTPSMYLPFEPKSASKINQKFVLKKTNLYLNRDEVVVRKKIVPILTVQGGIICDKTTNNATTGK